MADAPREIELKLELDPAEAGRLAAHPLLAGAQAAVRPLSSVYFDTRKCALRKAGFTLRVRAVDGGFVQTAKAAAAGAGLFDRAEWEQPLGGDAPDPAALAGTPLAALLTPAVAKKLRPVVRSSVQRTLWQLQRDGARIELALDQGEVEADGEVQPICELELELKGGRAEPLFALARALAADLPLDIAVLSKAERGFALADGLLGRVAKAEPVALDPAMRVAEGFAAIVAACLRHFRRNAPLVRGARDAAALHQARVAMRRLRSAFSLFGPALRDDRFPALREELRWFTATLGDARNLDVFLARTGGAADRETLEAARARAYDVIVEALASPRFRLLEIDLVAWTATGAWRLRRKARLPLADFARARLERLWAKVAERGAALAELDEEERHRLRIDIKKLRYAVEFLAALHAGAGGRKRFAAALETMQESLGHLNDMATARTLRESLDLPPTDEQAPESSDEAAHLAETQRAFSRLTRAGPFWRVSAAG